MDFNSGSRAANCFEAMSKLKSMLAKATPEFHRRYEQKNNHAAALEVFLFWLTEKLLSEYPYESDEPIKGVRAVGHSKRRK